MAAAMDELSPDIVIDSLRSEIDRSSGEIQQLRNIIEEHKASLQGRTTQIDALKNQIQAYEIRLAEAQSSVEEQQLQIEEFRMAMEAILVDREGEVASFREQLRQKVQEADRLEDQIASLELQLDQQAVPGQGTSHYIVLSLRYT